MVTQSTIYRAICCASDNLTTIQTIFDANPSFVKSDGDMVLAHYATRAKDGDVIFKTLLTKYIRFFAIHQLNKVLTRSIEYDQCANVRLLLEIFPALRLSQDNNRENIFQFAAPLRLSEQMCDVLFAKFTKLDFYYINRNIKRDGCLMTLAQIAAKNGNLFFLKHLFVCDMTSLTTFATPQTPDILVNDKSTLELAVEQREIKCARFLVETHPELCSKTNGRVLPLFKAVQNADLPMIELLVRGNPCVLELTTFHDNPFVEAVRRLSVAIVLLLAKLMPICIRILDIKGRCVLSHANSEVMMECLLQLDPTLIDIVDDNGQTTLHNATQNHLSIPAISVLLAAKPSMVNQTDKQGRTPLEIAWRHHATHKVVEAMLMACPTVQFEDKYGNTTCHLAARTLTNESSLRQVFTTNINWLTHKNFIALNPLAIALQENNRPATLVLLSLMPVGDVVETFVNKDYDFMALQKLCHEQCDKNVLLPDLWDCVFEYVGFPPLARHKRKHDDNP